MTEPNCPLCGGPAHLAFIATDRNRALSRNAYRYARCERCGVLTLLDVPADLGRFYAGDYHRIPDRTELVQRAETESFKLDVVRATGVTPGDGPLVEIGSGYGAFALLARDAGFAVSALEMDAECCALLREEVGVDAVQTTEPAVALAARPESAIVVAWQVLEHLPDPWSLLRAAAANLIRGGVLVVATPNPRSLGFRMLGRRWAHLDAPRHLSLLPASAIIAEAARHGLHPDRLTSADGGEAGYNLFAWDSVLTARGLPLPVRLLGRLVRPFVYAGAAILAPVERRGMRGSSYTLVLRKS